MTTVTASQPGDNYGTTNSPPIVEQQDQRHRGHSLKNWPIAAQNGEARQQQLCKHAEETADHGNHQAVGRVTQLQSWTRKNKQISIKPQLRQDQSTEPDFLSRYKHTSSYLSLDLTLCKKCVTLTLEQYHPFSSVYIGSCLLTICLNVLHHSSHCHFNLLFTSNIAYAVITLSINLQLLFLINQHNPKHISVFYTWPRF